MKFFWGRERRTYWIGISLVCLIAASIAHLRAIMSSSSSVASHSNFNWIDIPFIDSEAFEDLRKQIQTTQLAGLPNTPPNSSAASLFSSHFSSPVSIKPPSQWQQPASSAPTATRAHAAWTDAGLQVLFEIHGSFGAAQDDPADKMSILQDSRVEVFLSPFSSSSEEDANKQQVQSYTSYEMNSAGRALDFKVTLPNEFDYKWSGSSQLLHAWSERAPASSSSEEIKFMWIQLPWRDFCNDEQIQAIQKPSSSDKTPLFHLGLYRGDCLDRESGSFLWHSWVDPLSPRIAFHVPASFGKARLLPTPRSTK